MSGETKSELSLGQKIKRFFKGVKAEYSKIIFPSRETLRKQTVAVIIVAVFLAAIIAAMDFVFTYLMGLII